MLMVDLNSCYLKAGFIIGRRGGCDAVHHGRVYSAFDRKPEGNPTKESFKTGLTTGRTYWLILMPLIQMGDHTSHQIAE
jgi:hypothetical protein